MSELELLKHKTHILTMPEVRYNQNHGKDGRFTVGSGSGYSGSAAEAVQQKTELVTSRLSNQPKPISKQDVDMAEVQSRGGVNAEQAKECVAVAEAVFNEAAAKEPIITDDVVSSVADVGGQMYGLDYRLKQPTSMAGKIGADASEDGLSFAEAGAKIKDAVRYTAVIEEGDFTQGYESIKASLESKGYTEVRCKNFFASYGKGKSDQKAVQCVYEDRSGFRFELQFHTPRSQGAKELNHPRYEEQRKKGTSNDRRRELSKEMRHFGAQVPNPAGVMTIQSHG